MYHICMYHICMHHIRMYHILDYMHYYDVVALDPRICSS